MQLEPLNDLALIRELGAAASDGKAEIYAVGGCVRDWALGRPAADLDFLLSSAPTPVAQALVGKYGGVFTRFDKFLTVRVFLENGRRVDFARFRKESYPGPAVLPVVEPALSVAEDLGRRDFSVNALALAVLPARFGEVIDPFGGLDDIRRGCVRALHHLSFHDDPTRIFRAARFAGRFGWEIDKETRVWIKESVKEDLPALLSRERLRNELLHLLEEKNPDPAFAVLAKLDALRFFHRDFIWPATASPVAGAMPRLAAIAAAMGRDGVSFLESLKLPNKTVAGIKSAAASRFKKHI
ncbi:MAG: CCA tRNA nucleotidyltransferase [Elusimicrobia bacterium]|nr:CCA tRNA nucleotidyltransferase [Elusimicrobiota bacterium]